MKTGFLETRLLLCNMYLLLGMGGSLQKCYFFNLVGWGERGGGAGKSGVLRVVGLAGNLILWVVGLKGYLIPWVVWVKQKCLQRPPYFCSPPF